MIQADTPYLETFIDTQDVIMSIGITDGEKGPENKQTVRVSVQMYQLQGRFDDGAIETCLDYSRVHDYIENWANRAHTDLVETLAEGLVDLDIVVQGPFDEGLHRFAQTCPISDVLGLVERFLVMPSEARAAVEELLAGSGDIMRGEPMAAQAWFDLLVPLVEIVAALPDSTDDLQDLLVFLGGIPGFEPVTDLTVLFEDPLVVEYLASATECLLYVESNQNYGILWGVAHIVASNEPIGGSEGRGIEEAPAISLQFDEGIIGPIQEILSGMMASPDVLENLRISLDWILNPSRVARLRPDIVRFLGAGAVQELLLAASRIGQSTCDVVNEPLEEPVSESAR